jgi:hypothetical protein
MRARDAAEMPSYYNEIVAQLRPFFLSMFSTYQPAGG